MDLEEKMSKGFLGLSVWDLFKKKEDQYPSHFINIKLNPIAKSLGLNDEFNKEIHIIKNGVVIEITPYSKKMLESIKKINDIPVFEEDYDEDEEYEYDSFTDLSVIKFKK
jgi:hypothetical protein